MGMPNLHGMPNRAMRMAHAGCRMCGHAIAMRARA